MKKIFLVLFSFFSFFSFSYGDSAQRRSQILSIINEEIKEIVKISSENNHKKPKLLLRIAELNLEKARLIKDKEQEDFRKISPKQRARTNKKKYFRKSKKYFVKAQKIAKLILKKFKRFEPKENIYFILASNAREFEEDRNVKRYLNLALKSSKKGSEIYKRSSLTLAGIYYNEKKYRKSSKFYREGLQGKRDKWWTRDAYNLAWSYYREKKYDRALDLMKEVHRLSKNSKYIDMKNQAERDIGVFYVSAGDPSGGARFFKSIGKNISSKIMRLSQNLIDQGKMMEAEKFLLSARKNENNESEIIKIDLILLDLYKKNSNHSKHVNVAQRLVSLDRDFGLKKKEKETLLYHLKYMVGTLQKKIITASKKSGKKGRKNISKNSNLAGKYFIMISLYEKKEKGKYLYLRAETFFAGREMEKAYEAYRDSFSYAKRKKNIKQMRLSVKGMLAALASPYLADKVKKKHYISTYKTYLEVDKKSKRAEKIYQRIFKEYFNRKDFVNSKKVLKSYQKNFPQSIETVEIMVAKITDHYKKIDDKKSFAQWINEIESGKYRVSKQYIKNAQDILRGVKFQSIDKMEKAGNKKGALNEYLRVYNDSGYSREDRKKAAHNIAVLYFELGYADQMYEWAGRALSIMSQKDLSLHGNVYLSISSELFNMQRFQKSAHLSENIYKKICEIREKKKDAIYKNTYIVYLSIGNLKKASEVISSGERCGISPQILSESQLDLLESLSRKQEWKKFEFYLEKARKRKKVNGRIIVLMAKLRNAYRDFSYKDQVDHLENEMETIFKKSSRLKEKMNPDSRWVIAEMRLMKMEKLVKDFYDIKLVFPLKKFENSLEKKLNLLDKIDIRARDVFNTKSGRGAIRAYQLIIESYQRLAKEIRSVEIKGKDKDFIKGFRKSMRTIEIGLIKKSGSRLAEARKIIASGKALSPQAYWFISKNRIPFNVGYYFTGDGVIMDRLGRK